jgi:phosphomannomutase
VPAGLKWCWIPLRSGRVNFSLLLKELGCTVYEINSEPTGIFAHIAEPLNENLSQLEEAVAFYGADIGFATDPDVDRLSLFPKKENVSEKN